MPTSTTLILDDIVDSIADYCCEREEDNWWSYGVVNMMEKQQQIIDQLSLLGSYSTGLAGTSNRTRCARCIQQLAERNDNNT